MQVNSWETGEWWWLFFTTGFWGGLLQGDRLDGVLKVVSHLPTAPHSLASGHQPQNCLLALATELSGCDPESECSCFPHTGPPWALTLVCKESQALASCALLWPLYLEAGLT